MIQASFDEDTVSFLHQVWRSRGAVGAILPSSARLAETLVDMAEVSTADRIMELGAGTGAITSEIMRKKTRSAEVLAIERDARFARTLRARCPEARVVNQCASRVQDIVRKERFGLADCTLSTLPWAILEVHVRSAIIHAASRCLKEDGVFVTVTCYGLHWLPSGWSLRRSLRSSFTQVVQTRMIVGSFPPMVVYRCFGKRRWRDSEKAGVDEPVLGLASSPAYQRLAARRGLWDHRRRIRNPALAERRQ